MKSIYKLFIILAFLGIATTSAYSYEKDVCLGLGVGSYSFIYQDYLGYDYTYSGALGSIFAVFTNGFGNKITPELCINSYIDEINTYSADLKVRYYPWAQKKLAPYGYVGVGYYSWDSYYSTAKPLYLPVGVGITHFFTPKFGLDFNLGYNISTTNITVGKLSALFRLASWGGEADSDGDGLSDVDEAKYKTDANNPDTDNDGLLDGKEVYRYKTNPKDRDTDNGGITDGVEVNRGSDPLDKDDDILSINIGDKLILRGIEFETGKTEITARSERILGFALKAMKSAKYMQIEICGHTDDVGKISDNDKLSLDRANAVKKWLVSRGVSESMLTTRGAGSSEPLVPNTSDENRQRNRRVEFYRTK
jgi:outer membrane protein OmpA-like peptidoglycan-associated protein